MPAGRLVTVPEPEVVTETDANDSRYGLSEKSGHPGMRASK
jgi:hypothetical protein